MSSPAPPPCSHDWLWRGDRFEYAGLDGRRLVAIRSRCRRCGWWKVVDAMTGAETLTRERP